MVQKKQKVSKSGINHGKFENDPHLSERIIILLFLIFVVMSVVILLTGFLDYTFTSLATGGLNMQGNQYNGNEQLRGNFVFSLDSRDVLPANSTFVFSILTNASKCSFKYSCFPSTSNPVNWYAINSTTGVCGLIEQDPEGECCLRQGASCPQVILNKDFNDGTNKWTANAGKTIINTETLRWDEGENQIASVVMYQDGSKFKGGTYNFSISQLFDSRKIQMDEELHIEPKTCHDSDGGYSGVFEELLVYGSCKNDSVYENDTCVNSTFVREWDCVGGVSCVSRVAKCPSGLTCQNGACLSAAPTIVCTETDGGKNPNLKGRTFLNYSNGTGISVSTDVCYYYEYGGATAAPKEGLFYRILDFLKDKLTGKALSPVVQGAVSPSSVAAAPGSTHVPASHRVKEYFCYSNNNTVSYIIMNCTNNAQCINGACYVNTEVAAPSMFSSGPGAAGESIRINWSFGYEQIEGENGALEPCAFEIVVLSNTSRSLHYYYPLATSEMYECNSVPIESATDKYINLIASKPSGPSIPSEGTVILAKDSRFLINDWQLKFGTETKNDYVNEIKVISKKRTKGDGTVYGQKVFVEYVNLFKNSTLPETNCTKAGRKCCLTGTGFGTYYGQQLNCSTDYECWSSCSDTQTLKLTQFIAKSDNYDKKNRTSDECQAWVDGVKTPADGLYDQCYEGIVGKGYTLAYSDGEPVSYTLDLSSITLRAPNQNGTYSLKVRYQYSPVSYPYPCYDDEGNALSSCMIFEKFAPFIVGDGGQGGGCTSNWINITPWSDCINNVQRRTMRDTNGCNPDYNATQVCGCSVVWGNCVWQQCQGTNQDKLCQDTTCSTGTTNVTETRACCTEDWQSSEGDCIDGLKTITYSDVNACGTTFNKPNDDTITCKEKKSGSIFSSWIIWVVIVIILLGAFVFLLLSVLKKKPKKVGGRLESRISSSSSNSGASGENSEIVAYINEAVASGLSKEDIKAKLSEAGWPDDVIEKSFLDAGI